jgi:serine/threonine protein kinase
MHECKLAGIRNHQRLQLLFEEVVADDSGPTLADFNFLACLGEGVSACVFLVRHTASGKLFALKQIKKEYFK